jgi:dephospho-CoA kinase
MKTIIYLTGEQGTGKSILVKSFKNAIEIEVLDWAKSSKGLLKKAISENENILITSNIFEKEVLNALSIDSKNFGCNFYHIDSKHFS